MSKFFINRPIFAMVISILILLGGAISILSLPIAQYPEVVPPVISVTAMYPGADPKVLADTVAAPIEQQVNGVENMMYMSSTCNADGSYNLNVTFELGTDVNMAQVLVQNRVNLANPKLPPEVTRQGVTVKKKSVNFVTIGTLSSPSGKFDTLFIANYALININDILYRLPGVGDVVFLPKARDYTMRLWLDPEKMRSRDLTTTEVLNALKEQNVQVAAGSIGAPPAPAGQPFQYTLTTMGRLNEAAQFEDIIVKNAEGGRFVRVKDVGRVELGAQTYDTNSTLDGKPAVTFLVYQLPGSNALDLALKVEETMKDLSTRFPEGLEYKIVWNVKDPIEASIEEVLHTLVEAFVLVVIVVFIFLQSLRMTLIPVITIPVALIGTFMLMSGMGFSINMLTLLGLVLAIGIVVDDAIVVVEAVEHIMHTEKLSPKDATIKAMEQMTGPIVGITLVLMAVFVPTAFMPGISGQMFRQFALTIAVSTGFSAINALTLSPALAALILKPAHGRKNIFFRGFNAAFDKLTAGYAGVVKLAIRRAAIALILYAGLVYGAGKGFASLPTGFVPPEDNGLVLFNFQLPDAASLERTQAVLDKASAVLSKIEGVDSVVLVAGQSFLDNTFSSSAAAGYMSLKPWHHRYAPERIAKENLRSIVMQAQAGLSKIQEAVAFAFPPPPILGLGNAGGFQLQILDKQDAGLLALEEATALVVEGSRGDATVTGANSRFRSSAPLLFADVDRTKVKALGIPLQNVFDTMQAYLGSSYVNDFNKFGRTWQVRVQAESKYRSRITDVQKLELRNPAGKMVPLGTLARIEERLGPPSIVRFNLYPTAAINGSAAPGKSSGDALKVMEGVADARLPDGFGYSWIDMAFQEKRLGNQAIVVFGLAILVVFLVLAAQYESWTNPLAVVLAIPTALLGAAIAINIAKLDLNVFTQVGLVLLVALAAKNAILIVEFAREQRAHGKPLVEAAIEGARLRFRPILMTSIAFNLGVLPLVLGTGAGAGGRVSIGVAVFGGMIAATIFPVVFVPVLYVVLQGFSEWMAKGKKGEGEGDGGHGHGHEAGHGAGAGDGAGSEEGKVAGGGHGATTTAVLALVAMSLFGTGCAIGPDYERPPVQTSTSWVDAKNPKLKDRADDNSAWWKVFGDPVLEKLVDTAYAQNLTLRQAGLRVLEARAFRGVAAADFFPQVQSAFFDYSRQNLSANNAFVPPNRYFNAHSIGLEAVWEVDVWGKFRRGIESADETLLASVLTYDDALVSLVSSVADAYVVIRAADEQIAIARKNVEIQRSSAKIAQDRFEAGGTTELDVAQARGQLADTQATIPQLEITRRQAENALCVLLGMPVQSLAPILGKEKPLPKVPAEVAIGIPAEVIARRPDVRAAEAQAAAQCALIGVAQADLLPHIQLVGTLGWSAERFSNVFRTDSFYGAIGPSVTWDILNYGGISSNVRVQDARFEQLLTAYQDVVLRAGREAEDAIVAYLKSQEQLVFLSESVTQNQKATDVAQKQYMAGAVDLTRVIQTQASLFFAQQNAVGSRLSVARGLIALQRALGGGWQLRSDKEFVPAAVTERMRARTDWSDVVDPAIGSKVFTEPDLAKPHVDGAAKK